MALDKPVALPPTTTVKKPKLILKRMKAKLRPLTCVRVARSKHLRTRNPKCVCGCREAVSAPFSTVVEAGDTPLPRSAAHDARKDP